MQSTIGKREENASGNQYAFFLDRELSLPQTSASSPLVLDLFAGCGGLGLGFEAAGFRTMGYEMLAAACETYNKNLRGKCHKVFLDAESRLEEGADVIIGGVPCQPFSVGGNQKGSEDSRDGFPAFLSAVKRFNPKIAIFENVRGMLYRNKPYFDSVISNLKNLNYIVEWKMLNSADYGVPQKRDRLFVVAHRGVWKFPSPIKHGPYTAGDALGELALSIPKNAKFLTKSMEEYVKRYERKSFCKQPRDLHLHQPSRTVTCRNLSGATSDMLRIRLPDGRRRRLTTREGARLQSFPDWFKFTGTEADKFNQIGNAVPPLLAKSIAKSVIDCLKKKSALTDAEIQRRNFPLRAAV